jgi:hypothetical protein
MINHRVSQSELFGFMVGRVLPQIGSGSPDQQIIGRARILQHANQRITSYPHSGFSSLHGSRHSSTCILCIYLAMQIFEHAHYSTALVRVDNCIPNESRPFGSIFRCEPQRDLHYSRSPNNSYGVCPSDLLPHSLFVNPEQLGSKVSVILATSSS